MKIFEYKTFKTRPKGIWQSALDTQELELYLNKLGNEGWELVSAIGTNSGGATNEIIFLFKREKLE